MDDRPLHVKYRPRKLADIVGQEPIVTSLTDALKPGGRVPHAFLFTGPAGCGKTTLARIVADMVGVDPDGIREVDAASNSGIDAMREIVAASRHLAFGAKPNRMVIVDEAHALSKQAWDALLKPLEEPPAHLFFALCTTLPGKVPKTIVTRCHQYQLREVGRKAAHGLLNDVMDLEGMDTPDDIVDVVLDSYGGSVRQALVMLSMVAGAATVAEAERLLSAPTEDVEVIELCRLVAQGKARWSEVIKLVTGLPEGFNPESVRIQVMKYLEACLMSTRDDRDADKFLDLLACFSKPFDGAEGKAPLLLALGRALRNAG